MFKYDPNSEFYNDNCFSYTTENGTDIILNDRKQEFTRNKLSLCESNCNFTGYNEENKKSSCDCNIKNKMDLVSEIIDNPVQLSNNFDSEEGSTGASNIISIKCTKALFSKEGLKSNISSYILIIFIMHFLLSIVLFIKFGYRLLINDINDIVKEKEMIQKEISNINQLAKRKTKRIKKKNKKIIKKKEVKYPPKKYNLNIANNNINSLNKNKTKKNISETKLDPSKQNNKSMKKTQKRKKEKSVIKFSNKKATKNITKTESTNKVKISFNDYELNTFDYRNAILYDKRKCCDYYLSLIKTKNPILFSFCPFKDYNSMIIRLCIFSISFSIYYAINFVFFDDKIMHKIYEMGGKYDIVYFIPKIAISFIVSYYLTIIIKLIFLSERNIAKVRMVQVLAIVYSISDKVKKNLIIKYTLFFILGLIFLFFFWMLLSSFGAVYPNTQMFIFKNTLISLAISLCYPFFFSLFPTIFRISSLNSNQQNNECIYKVSKFLQIL